MAITAWIVHPGVALFSEGLCLAANPHIMRSFFMDTRVTIKSMTSSGVDNMDQPWFEVDVVESQERQITSTI